MAKKDINNQNDKDLTNTPKGTGRGKKGKDDLVLPPTSGDVKGPRSSSDRSIDNPASEGENSTTAGTGTPLRSGKVKGPRSSSDRSIDNPASEGGNIKKEESETSSGTGKVTGTGSKSGKSNRKSASKGENIKDEGIGEFPKDHQDAPDSGPTGRPKRSNKSKIKPDDEELKMPSATGDQKGAMAKRKAATTAKDKYPVEMEQAAKEQQEGQDAVAKGGKNTSAKGKTTTGANDDKKLPKPKKALPKKTASSEDITAQSKSGDKTASTNTSTTGSEDNVQSSGSKKPKAKTTGTGKRSKTSTDAPKSEARKKKESKASKESSDSSLTDDLKGMAIGAAKGLVDKFLPDEETQRDIKETAKEILPDQEDILRTAKDLKNKLSPEIEQVKKVKDQIIDEDKISEKADKIKTTAKRISNRNEEKAAEKKFDEISLLSEYDVHLFKEGKHFHLYKKFGSHPMEFKGQSGVYFALWAPNAEQVSVIGDFNEWYRQANPMKPRQDGSGIWEAFVPEAKKGSLYKYFIKSTNGYEVEKGDPFAFFWEVPPNTASVVWDLESTWNDQKWMESRKAKAGTPQAISVYELHVGSWKRVPEDNMRSLTYRELAEELPRYLNNLGFTHVEFMPVMEHPFFGSWGYQVTGYFAPSSRFGTPQDFMFLIDALHQAGIGVILDWVPSHFPSDMHGLHYFDGTFLYEHADPQKGFHPDWQSYIFNYGRNEVRSFLISNSLFWLDRFHADGLRVDAVASMLYLDYSRKHGEWQPNEHGGNENLEAISFLKEFNEVVYAEFPDAMTIAEESTAWPMVSKPTYMGGLGFGQKWMMGWMHDTLDYFQKDPIHRKHHQNTITFSTTYAFSENFMLPLSHDEVVYGKHSIWNKMPGDTWNKFANLRSLYAYMFAHPGTKLLFMGAEFGQATEWNHDSSLDWHITEGGYNKQVQETIKALNNLYTSEPALYEKSFDPEGFEWVDINDSESSVVSFLRKGENPDDTILVVCNLTPVARENYRIGVPAAGNWREIFNSDDESLGGSNVKNQQSVQSEAVQIHQKDHSVSLTLPPMGVVYLKREKI